MKRKTTIIHKIKRKKRKQKDCRKLIKKFIESFKNNKNDNCSTIELEQNIKREFNITDLTSGENIKFSISFSGKKKIEVAKEIFDFSEKKNEYLGIKERKLLILTLLQELYSTI